MLLNSKRWLYNSPLSRGNSWQIKVSKAAFKLQFSPSALTPRPSTSLVMFDYTGCCAESRFTGIFQSIINSQHLAPASNQKQCFASFLFTAAVNNANMGSTRSRKIETKCAPRETCPRSYFIVQQERGFKSRLQPSSLTPSTPFA